MSMPAPPVATPLNATALRPAGPCRILLVDGRARARPGDDAWLRNEPALSVCGRCSSVAEALDALPAARPDVVITDLMLADGDAFELLRRLCKKQPGARVLVLSARHEVLCAERLLRAGALGYVMRSAPTEEIRRAIRRVAAGEMHISATLGIEFQRRFVHPQGTVRGQPGCALEVLSTREFQVFQLIGNGLAQAQIAAALSVSVKTIESHRQHVRDKLSLGSVAQFARCALECATRCRLERGKDATCELDPRHRPLPGAAGFRIGA